MLIYLGTELIESIVRMLKAISKLPNPPQQIVSLCQVSGGFLSFVQAASKALHILIQPRYKLLSMEAVLVLAQKRDAVYTGR